MQQRPTGVTILAILAVIGGLLGLCGSLTLFGVGGLGMLAGEVSSGATAGLFGALGVVSAILYLAFGFGAWTLKPWAWLLGIIGAGVSVASNLLSLVTGNAGLIGAVIGLIIPGIILWYLFRPEIKAAFGRA
jgi:hypothetical protein